jgi:tetratricopeptide (TPR) repeat protein
MYHRSLGGVVCLPDVKPARARRFRDHILPLLLATLAAPAALRGQDLRTQRFMEEVKQGFTAIYNIDYNEADRVFARLQQDYPTHPAPPLYRATVVWLRELFERQDLDLDKFIAPTYFTEPTDRKMPSGDRKSFFALVDTSQRLSEKVLASDARNADARYFLGGAHGVAGAFAITIDHSYSDAFGQGKKAYKSHHDLVEERPDYYDAYMSVGLYEYIVGNLPWYIKWIAMIVGYRGSEERGFDYLKWAAEKGLYAADDARTLQMVLFVRENRLTEALENARFLHRRYPRNFLLHLNQAQILEKMARPVEAARVYAEILERIEASAPNYQKIPMPGFRLEVGRKLLGLGQLQQALTQCLAIIADGRASEAHRALAHLCAGQALDRLQRRAEAVAHYGTVLRLENHQNSRSRAREYLKRPFQGRS